MNETPPHAQNRIWSTNNGLHTDSQRRQQSPGHLSTISNQIVAVSAFGDNENGNGNGNSAHSKQRPHNVNTNLIGVESRFRRKYYHKVLLGSLIFLIINLLIIIIVLSITHKKSSTICRSNECLRTAANLIYAMDEQTDPCEDFYQFTCGRWAEEHPKPDSVTSNDWFRERQSRITRKLREFLKSNITDNEPEAVGKAKTIYKSCINTQLLDERDLAPLIVFLGKFQLPILPSVLNLSLPNDAKFSMGNFTYNWLQSVVSIKQYLSMDLIFGFDVFPDPLNRTINRIAFGTPEMDSALPFNNDDSHKLLRKILKKTIYSNQQYDNDNPDDRESEEEESVKHTSAGMTAYMAYMRKVIEIYLLYVCPDINQEDASLGTTDLIKQAVKVAQQVYVLKEQAENMTKPSKNPIDDIVYVSLVDLQNQTDKNIMPKTMPIWIEYLELIMQNTKYEGKLNFSELKIITSDADIMYLQNMIEYLQETPEGHIESYLWLSIIEELLLHTTSEMRLLHSEYMRLVIGTEGNTPRSLYCAHGVNSLMGMAASYVLADDDFKQNKLPRVQRMLNDIRRSFDKLVRTTNWMDAPTKRKTMQKSAEMKSFIGFPSWITNHTALDEHYAGLRVNMSTHLENMVGVLHWQMINKLNNFEKHEQIGWATSPSNVNAFHTFQANAITIPIAILQYPFYDLGLEALNYGSIGTILGHELTHGFDDSGRMFDKDGNMVQWWSNQTINEYVNRTECFIEQYSHYYLSDINEYINGDLTLSENIADNGGMREAYYAYKLYIKDMGRERLKLPGLERYTHEQLFFISFGNLWCETYTPAASRFALEDSHCPGKIRLKGVLSNSEEFARAFKCKTGSVMNPDEPKCRIW